MMHAIDRTTRQPRNHVNDGDALIVTMGEGAAVPSATLTNQAASFATAAFDAPGAAIIETNVTALTGTAPTVTPKVQWTPDNGVTWVDYPGVVGAAITGPGKSYLYVGTGLPAAANVLAGRLPRRWRMFYTLGGTTPNASITTSVTRVS